MPSTRTPTQITPRSGQAPTNTVDGSALSFPVDGGGNHDGLYALLSGIDDKYRRATTPSFGIPNTPGSGAVWTRDGQAIEATPVVDDWTANRPPDPFQSFYRVGLAGDLTATARDPSRQGDMGYVLMGTYRSSDSDPDGNERSTLNQPLAGFATLNVRSIEGETVDGNQVHTRFSQGAAATLNPGGSLPDTIEISAPNYFRHTSGNSAICLKHDIILVEYPDGTEQAYIPWSMTADNRVRVANLGQGPYSSGYPVFPNPDEAVNITWVQPLFAAGGGVSGNVFGGNNSWAPLTVIYPTRITDDLFPSNQLPAMRIVGESPSRTVLIVGHHDPSYAGTSAPFSLQADGSLWASRVTGILNSKGEAVTGITGNYTYTFALPEGASSVGLRCSAGVGTPLTLGINIATTSNLSQGDRIAVTLDNQNGANITIDWGSILPSGTGFLFSGGDDQALPNVPGVYKWEGLVHGGPLGSYTIHMTRTDY